MPRPPPDSFAMETTKTHLVQTPQHTPQITARFLEADPMYTQGKPRELNNGSTSNTKLTV